MDRSLSATSSVISLPRVSGQIVHDDGLRRRPCQQRRIELPGAKDLPSFGGFRLLTHTYPGVGVENVRVRYGEIGIGLKANVNAGVDFFCVGQHFLVQGVTFRRTDGEVQPEVGAGQRQRGGDVVAIAQITEPQSIRPAKMLADGQHVGKRLAGVPVVAEPVDDRYAGPGRQVNDILVGVDPRHDALHHAG